MYERGFSEFPKKKTSHIGLVYSKDHVPVVIRTKKSYVYSYTRAPTVLKLGPRLPLK